MLKRLKCQIPNCDAKGKLLIRQRTIVIKVYNVIVFEGFMNICDLCYSDILRLRQEHPYIKEIIKQENENSKHKV